MLPLRPPFLPSGARAPTLGSAHCLLVSVGFGVGGCSLLSRGLRAELQEIGAGTATALILWAQGSDRT